MSAEEEINQKNYRDFKISYKSVNYFVSHQST